MKQYRRRIDPSAQTAATTISVRVKYLNSDVGRYDGAYKRSTTETASDLEADTDNSKAILLDVAQSPTFEAAASTSYDSSKSVKIQGVLTTN